MQGFGDGNATPQRFREVLNQMGCPDLKPKGAFIPRSCDYPIHNHIILIGDAGGFPNRLTAEGLYYAFLTASHAAEAITSGRPFAEVNAKVFAHKKKELWEARFFYSKTGLWLLRFLCNNFPGFLTRCYNRITGTVVRP